MGTKDTTYKDEHIIVGTRCILPNEENQRNTGLKVTGCVIDDPAHFSSSRFQCFAFAFGIPYLDS